MLCATDNSTQKIVREAQVVFQLVWITGKCIHQKITRNSCGERHRMLCTDVENLYHQVTTFSISLYAWHAFVTWERLGSIEIHARPLQALLVAWNESKDLTRTWLRFRTQSSSLTNIPSPKFDEMWGGFREEAFLWYIMILRLLSA
jgi:hypothetical protein